ncbi:universal stress protein [Arthrobacter halodurans]|uniref:Universal stress protein n=1 Tax=Arthrobacter halodurans TaxID=516699 RepID=A0ABV4UR57_9MICC
MENVVLVGVDGSAESREAAGWATAEAAARGWPLLFANACPQPVVADPLVEAAYLLATGRAAEPMFADLAAAARALGVVAECRVLRGSASDVLVRLSARAGLNVVGRRPRAGLPSRLGSVSSTLAAHSHCPTAVIPYRPPSVGHRDGAVSRSMFAGHVVAAVEPGPSASEVLTAAADLAQRHGLVLSALTVDSTGDRDHVPYPAGHLTRIGRQYPGLECGFHSLSGRPSHEIAQVARHAWMLVVGTRGFSGLSGIVHASVSQALLQHASSPVLVVPHAASER